MGENRIGNVEAKALICVTHGHELWGGGGREGWAGWSGVNGGEWDDYNIIINKYVKIYKRSINGKYKIERGRLRIVWKMEKSRNVHVQPMDMN